MADWEYMEQQETASLRRENAILKVRAERAELWVEIQKSLDAAERGTADTPGGALMDAAVQMAPLVGIVALCAALGLSRATFYRRRDKTVRARRA